MNRRREHRAVLQAYRNATLSGATHSQAIGILTQAAQQAIQGGPQAVQQFMQAQGFPQNGAWCGQFAAAVVRSTGQTPPNNPEVASNWRNFGTPTNTPHPGDVAIRRATGSFGGHQVSTGNTGSHVTFVGGVDPRTGTFTGLGGNQGANRYQPTAPANYPINGFDFRTPSNSASLAVPPSPMPTPITGAGNQWAAGTTPNQGIRQSDVSEAAQAMAQPAPNVAQSYDIPLSVPPSVPNVPDYSPQTFETGMSPDFGVPQSLDPSYQSSGINIPNDYGYGNDFSSVVPSGSYVPTANVSLANNPVVDFSQGTQQVASQPQYVGNFDLSGGQQQQSYQGVPTMDLGGFSQSSGVNFYTDPNTGSQYVFSNDGSMYPAFSNYQVQPAMNLNVDTNLDTPTANVASNDIQNFGGNMSLGSDVPSADSAFLGLPGTNVGGDAGTQDFYAANNQYGEGGWYYDSNGTPVPNNSFTGVQAGSDQGYNGAQSQAYDPLSQGSIGQPGGVSTIQGTIVGDNGMYMQFDPQTGTYQPTGVMSGSTVGGTGSWSNTGYGSSSQFGAGWAGTGGAGFGGYGGLGGSGAPQFSTTDDPSSQPMHGGVDPTGADYAGYRPTTIAESGGGGGDSEAELPQSVMDSAFAQEQAALASGWTQPTVDPSYWAKRTKWSNALSGASNGSQSGGGSSLWWGTPITNASWTPQTTTSPSSPPPTAPPTGHGYKGGGQITDADNILNIAQWMNRKSGKVPGIDHGRDAVHALLEPGEIVVNDRQMAGLKIRDKSKLRLDQIRAIKGAQKKKAA